jgi:alkanesulfonate monooxygenase SsuD/methylene tetrahydromethanopterin reductase-like flavin-dependent oxidoreductase (luciferase family)
VSPVKLGVTLPQFSGDVGRLSETAQAAEELGLDSLWVFDHLWPLSGGKERPILEGWTTLSWLAAQTTRIGVGTLVTRSSLRHPAVTAKMAATVAQVAPGRVTIAVGSGDNLSRAENEAFGLPYHEGSERSAQLRSTVEVLQRFFRDGAVEQGDDFVALHDLPPSPRPDIPPKIWVAGRSKPVMSVAADLADGWNGWQGSPQGFAEDRAGLVSRTGGREFEFSWGGLVVLGADDADATTRLGKRDPGGFVVGGPETTALRLNAFVDAGAEHLTLTLAGTWDLVDLERLAREVRPLLR